jgi:hypothetical protein
MRRPIAAVSDNSPSRPIAGSGLAVYVPNVPTGPVSCLAADHYSMANKARERILAASGDIERVHQPHAAGRARGTPRPCVSSTEASR